MVAVVQEDVSAVTVELALCMFMGHVTATKREKKALALRLHPNRHHATHPVTDGKARWSSDAEAWAHIRYAR